MVHHGIFFYNFCNGKSRPTNDNCGYMTCEILTNKNACLMVHFAGYLNKGLFLDVVMGESITR